MKINQKRPPFRMFLSELQIEYRIFSRVKQDIISLSHWMWVDGAASLHLILIRTARLTSKEAKKTTLGWWQAYIILPSGAKEDNRKVRLQVEIKNFPGLDTSKICECLWWAHRDYELISLKIESHSLSDNGAIKSYSQAFMILLRGTCLISTGLS